MELWKCFTIFKVKNGALFYKGKSQECFTICPLKRQASVRLLRFSPVTSGSSIVTVCRRKFIFLLTLPLSLEFLPRSLLLHLVLGFCFLCFLCLLLFSHSLLLLFLRLLPLHLDNHNEVKLGAGYLIKTAIARNLRFECG